MKLYKPGCPVIEIEQNIVQPHQFGQVVSYCTNPILDLWDTAYSTRTAAARAWAILKKNEYDAACDALHKAKQQYNALEAFGSP